MQHELTLSLPSIHCAGCVRRVTTALQQLAGVEVIDTSATTKTTRLRYESDLIAPAQIEQALAEAGYPVEQDPSASPQRGKRPLNRGRAMK